MFKILALLLVLFLAPFDAYSENIPDSNSDFTKNIRFYAHTGFSKPDSPTTFYEFWNIGYNWGGGVGYLLFDGQYEISIFAVHSNFELDTNEYKYTLGSSDSDIHVEDGAISDTSFSLNLKLLLEKVSMNMAPYICGGLGLSITSADDVQVRENDDTNTIKVFDSGTYPFASTGLGIEIPVNQFQLFCEIQFQMIFQDNENMRFFPVKAGVIF